MIIIIFFIGMVIMVSGKQIGSICDISYIGLICNVVGGIVMGGSAVSFYRIGQKKKDEVKALAENFVGKEEYEKELRVIQSIEKILTDNQKTLRALEEKQIAFYDFYASQGVLRNDIECISNTIIQVILEAKCFLLDKQTASVEQILKLLDLISNYMKNIDSIYAESQAINGNLNLLHDDLDEMQKYAKLIHTNNDNVSKMLDVISSNYFECVNKIIDEMKGIKQLSEDIIGNINDVYERIDNINLMPNLISESVENLIKKFGDTVTEIQIEFKHLEEDVEEQEKNRTKLFKKIMEEIRDSTEGSNEDIAFEMSKLGSQYEQFEKVLSSIVSQMSHIAEEDMEIMKGFLNE